MSEGIGTWEEVTGHMREEWMDDEAVPASWRTPQAMTAAHAAMTRSRARPPPGFASASSSWSPACALTPERTNSYLWPGGLRHLIETRQRTCAAPGCRRPARRCDIDHTTPYHQGGRTCECNAAPLCR